MSIRPACLALALFAALPALAQPGGDPPVAPAAGVPAPARLDLVRAYELALMNDATLGVARAENAAQREALPQARARLLPQVSATASRFRNHLETRAPGAGGRTVTSNRHYFSESRALSLRQPLYRPAETAAWRQAEFVVEGAEARFDAEVQNLAVRVTGTYLAALLAQEQLALALAQKAAYETQLDAARKGFAAGAGTRTDIDEARARLDLAVAQELEARQNLGFSRRQLETLVGQPVTELVPLDSGRLPLAPPQPASLADWVALAEAASPEIRALQAQREVARLEVEKARAGHKPTLDMVGQWSVSDSDSVTNVGTRYDNKSVGLQLNVPLYAGGLVDSQTRQALAQLERAGQQLEAGRRDLGLRVEEAYRGVTEGVLRVRALEQAVLSATTVVESSRRSFQAGSRTLVDILNAEGQRVQAQRDLADARHNYIAARIQLQSLTGQADLATIQQANGWLAP